MTDTSLLYTAVYDDVDDALADLDAIEDLHEREMLGAYDAAVIRKRNGEPHIVRRADRPRARAIPEVFGIGTLRREVIKRPLRAASHELATELKRGSQA